MFCAAFLRQLHVDTNFAAGKAAVFVQQDSKKDSYKLFSFRSPLLANQLSPSGKPDMRRENTRCCSSGNKKRMTLVQTVFFEKRQKLVMLPTPDSLASDKLEYFVTPGEENT